MEARGRRPLLDATPRVSAEARRAVVHRRILRVSRRREGRGRAMPVTRCASPSQRCDRECADRHVFPSLLDGDHATVRCRACELKSRCCRPGSRSMCKPSQSTQSEMIAPRPDAGPGFEPDDAPSAVGSKAAPRSKTGCRGFEMRTKCGAPSSAVAMGGRRGPGRSKQRARIDR